MNEDEMDTYEQNMLDEPSQVGYCLPCAEEDKKREATTLDSKGEAVCDEHQTAD